MKNNSCIVIGASHAGVNFAFALRKEGWEGEIHLFDADPTLPYHRPPLSKAYLASSESIDQYALKSAESYEKEAIQLHLGHTIKAINRQNKSITLSDDREQQYDKLVIATGARPIIPPIEGIQSAYQLYPLRTAADVANIRKAMGPGKRVVIIGGGYIGLETAASLAKLGAQVTVLEREERILARVTAPVMSQFFQDLHAKEGVAVLTRKNVISIRTDDKESTLICSDGTEYAADLIVVGVGIHVNSELAEAAGLELENGIKVDASTRTSDENIYAIGDCTFHYNPHYDRFVRLESVQNAVDQAKVAAAAISGKQPTYDTIPWFWSDQYDVKLQMVGLSTAYTEALVRLEEGDGHKFSVWYFKEDTLLAVDAINNGKAYVLGTKFIKMGARVDKSKIVDASVVFKPANLLVEEN